MRKKTAAYNLPAEITDQHIAILGKTGSGKTFTAKGYVERLLGDGRRVCVFDPTGVWWGLRYKPNLKPGFRVPIVGGQHGDVTDADPDSVAALAAKHSVIVDVSEQLIGERHQFAMSFFKALYQYNRSPLHLIIDEADEVAPQNPMPDARVMLHQVDRIVRRGRTRGFIVTLISQRPAVLHKNVLSQANTLIAMQLTSSQDRKAVELWIKGQADIEAGKKVLASLPRLQTGQGYVWAPQFDVLERVRFPVIASLDSSRAPKYGEEALVPPDPASYAGEFKELQGLAERAPDPALNRKRGRGKNVLPERLAAPSPDALEKARAEGYERGVTAGMSQGAAAERAQWHSRLRRPVLNMRDGLMELAKALGPEFSNAAATPAPLPATKAPVRATKPPASETAKINTDLPEPTVRVLVALASRYPAKFTVGEWAALAGMAPRGGAWGKHFRTLKAAGLIVESNGAVQATEAALAICGPVRATAFTREDLIALWQDKLGGNTGKLLQALCDAGEHGLSREHMAEIVDMEPRGGAFGKLVRGLVRNNLAQVKEMLYFAGSVFDV